MLKEDLSKNINQNKMEEKMNKKIVSILILPLLVLIMKPFNLDLNQAIVLSALILTITSWAIGKPNKILTSLFLLGVFLIFGNTPVKRVLSFPISSSFLLIIFSFVFSQGIINSKLAKKMFLPLISKYGKTVYQFIFTMVITTIILVFTIPQPYSRVILISMIYLEYFKSIDLDKETKEVLMFGMFATNIIVHVLFKRGDIVLNNGILAVANVQMTELEWMKILGPPGIGLLVLGIATFIMVFRKELKGYKNPNVLEGKINLNRRDKINLGIIMSIILLWATESIHNVNGAIVVFIGLIIMYFRRIINMRDFKSVNLEVLIFLTAAFSIGGVMEGSGIADKIFGQFAGYLPDTFSYKFILMVSIGTMILHMVLGSSLTTISVAIPSFLTLAGGSVESKFIMLIVFLSVLTQYLLPFHNSLLVMGVGNNYFGNKTVFKFGITTIPLTLIGIFLLFVPWWKFIGFI